MVESFVKAGFDERDCELPFFPLIRILSFKISSTADRKVKTIAGRLVRELARKLAPDQYAGELALFQQVLDQKR